MSRRYLVVFPLCCLLALLSCGRKEGAATKEAAVVALSGDVESFNPIVTSSAISSEVAYALYPHMFEISFDLVAGKLIYKPALVKKWEFLNGGLDVKLTIRNDVRWENGVLVSPQDIKFTYDLVGDPEVASPRSNYVDEMVFTEGRFDVNKSIEILNDTTMIFHFVHTYPQQLFHLSLPPIPKHVYADADRRTLRSHPRNQKPLSAGPFSMEKWKRGEEITLVSNPKCVMPGPGALDRILFRVISDPVDRLTALKNGEVDVMWPLYYEDVKDITEKYPDIQLVTLPPTSYDYIAWANIDFQEYRKTDGKVIRPHKLFGDMRVRQALTLGIDRKSILDAKLGPYGELAVSDFSPVFRWALNPELRPYPYDPNRARELLKDAGWQDTNGDGILDKDGVPFKFSMMYDVGNARRVYAATVIQKNLKEIGIAVQLTSLEAVVMYEKVGQKDYDAYLGGFMIDLAIDPSNRWGDLRNPFNSAGFQNARVMELLKLGLHAPNETEAAKYWREIQTILHREQPFTFMYWIKDIVAINRRIKKTNINIMGILDGIGNWKIGDPAAYSTF